MITDLLSVENKDISNIMLDMFKNLCHDNCHFECIKLLIVSGKLDVIAKYSYNYAIQSASEKGHIEIVKLLLSTDKVDVTELNNYAIKSASEKGHVEIVKLLLSTDKVDVTAEDNFAIKYAAKNGKEKM